MGLDERLLGRNKDEESADNSPDARPSEDSASSSEGEQPMSLREAVLADKRKRQQTEEKEEGKLSAVTSPIRSATSGLLRQAWLNLITSWGLTLIWINIHAFLNMVVGDKMFCKLGDEWSDKMMPAGSAGSNIPESAKKKIELAESMGCGCIDTGCCLILLIIFAVISLIVGFFSGNPLEQIKTIFGVLWCAIGGCD